MGAGVDEGTDPAIFLPDDEDRLPANIGCVIVAMLGHLALMAQIDPDLAEHPIHFGIEHRRICVDTAVDAEHAVAGAVFD